MDVQPISAEAPELSAMLAAAQLPVEDLSEEGRQFFSISESGRPVGYGGFEIYGTDVLLRSIVVLPEFRGQGRGRMVTAAVLEQAAMAGGRNAFLLTTTAEEFFRHQGFRDIERSAAPAAILATRQASTICASASLLTRAIVHE